MTDYAEDQENELMALESMYPDELTGKPNNPFKQLKFLTINFFFSNKSSPICKI